MVEARADIENDKNDKNGNGDATAVAPSGRAIGS
jgi:hypothetical protein